MDHVKCKLCGAAHPLGGPHAWDKGGGSSAEERKPSKLRAEGSTPSRRSISSNSAPAADERLDGEAAGAKPLGKSPGRSPIPASTVTAAVPNKRGRPSTGFDKKAYQRELMRKNRAKLKSK